MSLLQTICAQISVSGIEKSQSQASGSRENLESSLKEGSWQETSNDDVNSTDELQDQYDTGNILFILRLLTSSLK